MPGAYAGTDKRQVFKVQSIVIYVVLSIIIFDVDVVLAVASFGKRWKIGRELGFTCLAAAFVDAFYLASVFITEYRLYSVLSSAYFIMIDVMLTYLLKFTMNYTGFAKKDFNIKLYRLIQLIAVADIISLAVNPFTDSAISYIARDTEISHFAYSMHFMYRCHLVICYIMVGAVVIMLAYKFFTTPREYKYQYFYPILGIVVVVGVNCVYLFLPGLSVYNLLDYSVLGYSIAAFFMHWGCFNYASHTMLNKVKNNIFEMIGQGLVMFDYEDRLILRNKKARELLPRVGLDEGSTLEDFAKKCGLNLNTGSYRRQTQSMQFYVRTESSLHPLRCDCNTVKNDNGQVLGTLFVITDAALDTDLLTGFKNWESVKNYNEANIPAGVRKMTVAVCDINNLAAINTNYGRSEGDHTLRRLAKSMKDVFPVSTFFARGSDANLIALCYGFGEEETESYLKRIVAMSQEPVQYAMCEFDPNETKVSDAVNSAMRAMLNKKLLDSKSSHSDSLTSLIKALQECDSDTEAHVRRTRAAGTRLGRSLGLNDEELSELSLLCLLHDIGKIGIPLDVLNKPGRLTDAEWNLIKTHVEKGYQIAKSSTQIEMLAEKIRYHHERWDGKGYPDGIAGENIPLLSRIISVVDAYDAMTNDRSYRKAKPQAEAVAELKRCAGTQFDPRVVDEYLRILDKIGPLPVEDVEDEFTKIAAENNGAPAPAKVHLTANSATKLVDYSHYILDGDFNIIEIDARFTELTGYTEDDIKAGLNQSDLIPSEDRQEYLNAVAETLAKNPIAYFSHRILCKDGDTINVICIGRVYYDSTARQERSEIVITEGVRLSTHTQEIEYIDR